MSRTEGSPFSRDDYRLADDMFREAVQANLAEEDNLESIRAAFEQRVNDAFERGEFIVEVKRLTVDHMWSRVNGANGKPPSLAGSIQHTSSISAAGEPAPSICTWNNSACTVTPGALAAGAEK